METGSSRKRAKFRSKMEGNRRLEEKRIEFLLITIQKGELWRGEGQVQVDSGEILLRKKIESGDPLSDEERERGIETIASHTVKKKRKGEK